MEPRLVHIFLIFHFELPAPFSATSDLISNVFIIFGWGFVGAGKSMVRSLAPLGGRKWALPIKILRPLVVDGSKSAWAHFLRDAER